LKFFELCKTPHVETKIVVPRNAYETMNLANFSHLGFGGQNFVVLGLTPTYKCWIVDLTWALRYGVKYIRTCVNRLWTTPL